MKDDPVRPYCREFDRPAKRMQDGRKRPVDIVLEEMETKFDFTGNFGMIMGGTGEDF